MSFELARKFPFQWALKHICFIKKWLRNRSSKMPTLLKQYKNHQNWCMFTQMFPMLPGLWWLLKVTLNGYRHVLSNGPYLVSLQLKNSPGPLIGSQCSRTLYRSFIVTLYVGEAVTAPVNKTCAFVQRLLEALKNNLEIKVRWVLKNSGNSLSIRHWNFQFWTRESWEIYI